MAEFFKDARPVFLLGAPRSGTTFLHQLMNTHPQVFLTDELRFVSWLVKEATKLNEGFDVHQNPYPVTFGSEFSQYLMNNAGKLVAPFYVNQAARAGKDKIVYWGDKYPHYDEVLHLMPAMFPRASYVMIHRDLRDVICSVIAGHGWEVAKSAPYITGIYARYIRKIRDLGDAPVHHVVYSDLSRDTRAQARDIFEFLDLPAGPEILDAAAGRAEIQAHSVRKGQKQHTSFDISKSEGRWERDLDPGQLSVVNESLSEISTELKLADNWVDGRLPDYQL